MLKNVKGKIITLIALLCTAIMSGCVGNDTKQTLRNIPQNIWSYIDPVLINSNLMDAKEQQQHLADYLSHYFSPWTGQNRIINDQQIEQSEINQIQQFTQNPGWNENHQPYNQLWIKKIISTMDVAHFPNDKHKMIVIETTDVRVLPTTDPSFTNWTDAGQGYPFDNLQESSVVMGTPALKLQTTTDGEWSLVLFHNDYGWVKSNTIANVDANFIKQWQTKNYVAITADETSLVDELTADSTLANLGSIYPLKQQHNNHYEILIPTKDDQNNAKIDIAIVDNKNSAILPIHFQVRNIAPLANALLGTPYGWGGIYQYRDCSSTLADLFTPFAIWMPRNSSDQMKMGNYISLAGLSRSAKRESIVSHGIPFLTLIGLPGHVMLYIGHANGNIYVVQNIWGLHTRPLFMPFLSDKRAIIGETIVVPLEFDKYYLNVPTPLIDKIKGIAVL